MKNPIDVVKYILFKCAYDGDVITNLKMQKVLYFVHAWYLVTFQKRCFAENFQAWPNGPVLPSIYRELKIFGSAPIDPSFTEINSENDLNNLKKRLGEEMVNLIDTVYEKVGYKSAFELVNLTHSDPAWVNARDGLSVSESSGNEILDKDVLSYYGKQK